MAYRLRRDLSVQESFVKVAREQVDKAVGEVRDPELDRHEVVHQVRKRCKKLRALIRLVRPEFEEYQKENEFFRDAARRLSYVRDAQSILECFDALTGRFQEEGCLDEYASIRQRLVDRRQDVVDDQTGLEARLEEFLKRMEEARPRLEKWRIAADGFAGVEGGLRKTYRRGRVALRKAYAKPSPDNFHEWRKRAKYHWYHLRLLRRIWPRVVASHVDAADDLGSLLGDAHDLAVLRRTLLAEPGMFGTERDVRACLEVIDRRCFELRSKARPLGERIFAEKPKRLSARFHAYWDTWRRRGTEM